MQYMRIFREKGDEFDRYWASISTEKTKDGKGTGKYFRSNISVRMSKDAEKTFNDNAEKSKSKGIKHLYGEIDGWLKAAETKEGTAYLYLFVNSIKPIQQSEEDDE